MRVGINVAVLSSPLTGVGYYALYLLRALVRVGEDFEWVFIGVDPSKKLAPSGERVQHFPASKLTGIRRVLWQQLVLPRLAFQSRVDVLHCPDFSRPLRVGTPVVNTIHDLTFLDPQSPIPFVKRNYKKSLAQFAITHSARLIAVSEFTRSEILRRFAIDESRVTVIHNGFEAGQPSGPDSASEVPGSVRRSPYLLFVSTLERRKNAARLVQAFSYLKVKRRIPHRLVLVGQKGWGWAEIRRAIEASPVAHEVELPGYLPREEVLRLYRNADVFIYPSVYEGFGFPVLEAMAAGTPVACSRVASLPEVAGEAAEFFDPYSVEDMAAALERVLESPERQAELRRKGAERVRHFSWEECARRHCQVYKEVFEG